MSPVTRPALSPGALYSRLSTELRARRPEPCHCVMPLPFLVTRADEALPNWRINPPVRCPRGCEGIIDEIIARFSLEFDLHDPTARPDGGD